MGNLAPPYLFQLSFVISVAKTIACNIDTKPSLPYYMITLEEIKFYTEYEGAALKTTVIFHEVETVKHSHVIFRDKLLDGLTGYCGKGPES